MADNASHYFARGNTARGAHFLHQSAFGGLNKLFVLTGPQGTGKSTVMRSLADGLTKEGRHVQCYHSPLRPEELDGFIVTALKVGVIDGRVYRGIPELEAREIDFIDFGQAFDSSLISSDNARELEALEGKLADAYSQAYETFSTALQIHDEWEKYYIASMDFAKADRIADDLIQALYTGHDSDTPAAGRHLFFGAATPKGAFDFIPGLTARLDRRIFIKGRPGSGKSTMLKKLAAAAEQKGIDVQIFHCGLDPNSLDMLIFPQLGTAIFDSTAPHEYFPERDGDEVLDVYALAMSPGTDEAYAAEIAAIKERYSAKMKAATAFLAEAEAMDARIRALHAAATDYARVAQLQQELQTALIERIGGMQPLI
ncbi:hypothetical protein [Cohnella sp. 56]|uniref:hypothetical protein n=1 Tax=Cohnella sp. 56 TaxID=3113722 RepID=UPI0030EA2354